PGHQRRALLRWLLRAPVQRLVQVPAERAALADQELLSSWAFSPVLLATPGRQQARVRATRPGVRGSKASATRPRARDRAGRCRRAALHAARWTPRWRT